MKLGLMGLAFAMARQEKMEAIAKSDAHKQVCAKYNSLVDVHFSRLNRNQKIKVLKAVKEYADVL